MATITSHQPFDGRAVKAIAGLLLAGASLWSTPAAAADRDIDFVCPCQVERTPTSATVTFGMRNFRTTDSGPLRVQVLGTPQGSSDSYQISSLTLHDTVIAGGARSPSTSYAVSLDTLAGGPYDLLLTLHEQRDGEWIEQDFIRLEAAVDLSGLPFSVGDLDILADADGDGVGDFNEALMGTDAADPDSTPGEVVIDVLVFYSSAFADHYNGSPLTRINDVMILATDIFRRSGVGIRLSIVRAVRAEVQNSASEYSRVDPALVAKLRDQHGADVVMMFRPFAQGNSTCGWANLGGWRARGYLMDSGTDEFYATIFGNCASYVTAHELGHILGLAHSFRRDRNELGTFRWARGHGVRNLFATIMGYDHFYNTVKILLFSDPANDCYGSPCGRDIDALDGADAVTSLNAVRYQVARYRESKFDTDEDGFADAVDAFPNDPREWLDTDADGIGNNADEDDDDDGVADANDAFPLDPLEVADSDRDGVGDNGDAFPNDPAETLDTDADGVGDNADVFPTDPAETTDGDGDGVGDNGDLFPLDPTEFADSDGDGVGNNADLDDDNDGVLDVADAYPFDPARFDIGSYKFLAEQPGDRLGHSPLLAADVDGDGRAEFIIGAPWHDVGQEQRAGAVYIISSADLAAADAADGKLDRIIQLGRAVGQPDSWKLVGDVADNQVGFSIASAGDVDGDGLTDLLIGAPNRYGSIRVPATQAGVAYLVAGADLPLADAADGARDGVVQLRHVAAQPGSWELAGETLYGVAGYSVAGGGDLDGDGFVDLIVGVPGYRVGDGVITGAAYLVSSADLAAADAADDLVDGAISLSLAVSQPGSWRFVGEATGSHYAGQSASLAGDADGDGLADLLAIGAPEYAFVENRDSRGAVYLVPGGSNLASLDALDGEADGTISLARLVERSDSWKLITRDTVVNLGRFVADAGDIDGDQDAELILGKPGTLYIVSSAGLAAADAANGTRDRLIDLRLALATGGARQVNADAVSTVGDVDGDGLADLIFASRSNSDSGVEQESVHLVSGAAFAATARKPNGVLGESDLAEIKGAWAMYGPRPSAALGASAAPAGDVDGDGASDLLLGAPGRQDGDSDPGAVYLLLMADLAMVDAADDSRDGALQLGNAVGDTDGDGALNIADRDDDGDGVADADDAFPLDPGEWSDGDADGVGDNADAFPDDPAEQFDTDSDGIGNNVDSDDDGDGVEDAADAFPLDPLEVADTDEDGVGNHGDAFPDNWREQFDTDGDGIGDNADADDDGDGVEDAVDAFPLDPSEVADADGDGVGNNGDVFPEDPAESLDTDGDGVGDNADAFPENPAETLDTDADGVGNNADPDDDGDGVADAVDVFPLHSGEWADSDGDGVGNNGDAFPEDPAESLDTDGDGVGDNADAFPRDAEEWLDTDGDGIGDNADAFPRDAEEWLDTDGDGIGNNADSDDDGDGIDDADDPRPLDPDESD